jgi:hypothetical protein
MLKVEANNRALKRLAKVIEGSSFQIKKETAKAINETVRKATRLMSQEVTQELAIPQKTVKEKIKGKDRAKPRKLNAKVTLQHSERIPLRDFKAKQTKKGVAYKISKRSGRKRIEGAFMVASMGNNVFARATNNPFPLYKLQGASPWGAFVKQKSGRKVRREVRKELTKQIDRRVRFIKLKKTGAI